MFEPQKQGARVTSDRQRSLGAEARGTQSRGLDVSLAPGPRVAQAELGEKKKKKKAARPSVNTLILYDGIDELAVRMYLGRSRFAMIPPIVKRIPGETELRRELSAWSTIGTLILIFHVVGRKLLFADGGKWDITHFLTFHPPDETLSLEIEGCDLGSDPEAMTNFGRSLRARKVTAWSTLHGLLGLELIEGQSVTTPGSKGMVTLPLKKVLDIYGPYVHADFQPRFAAFLKALEKSDGQVSHVGLQVEFFSVQGGWPHEYPPSVRKQRFKARSEVKPVVVTP